MAALMSGMLRRFPFAARCAHTRAAPQRRVALIHAMQPSIGSTLPAFERHWPEAELVHLLDDSLARDVGKTGIDESMARRFVTLARYARDEVKCDGILFTCSAFGAAIEEAQRQLRTESFPVLKPNEAMMEQAAGLGKDGAPIAVLSMFEPTLPSITRELADISGPDLRMLPRFVPGALEALQAGDETRCCALIAEAAGAAAEEARGQGTDLACVAFAMFSMARGRPAAEELLRARGGSAPPVLTSPDAAVLQMRRLLGC